MDQNPYDEEASPLPAAGASRALVPTQRHDGFTPKRRRKFLKALRETGCVQDACRKARISDSAVYKVRRRDPEFRAQWKTALSRAGADMEVLAWQRAVEGVEEEVIAYGKVVATRRKYDSALFRMMLQATDPERYGGRGIGSRKQIEKELRKKIEEEMNQPDESEIEEVRRRVLRKLDAYAARENQKSVDSGSHYYGPDGALIPVGYVWDPAAAAAAGQPAAPPESGGDAKAPNFEPDWPQSEPDFGPPRDPDGDQESRFSARKPRAEPRIRFL